MNLKKITDAGTPKIKETLEDIIQSMDEEYQFNDDSHKVDLKYAAKLEVLGVNIEGEPKPDNKHDWSIDPDTMEWVGTPIKE